MSFPGHRTIYSFRRTTFCSKAPFYSSTVLRLPLLLRKRILRLLPSTTSPHDLHSPQNRHFKSISLIERSMWEVHASEVKQHSTTEWHRCEFKLLREAILYYLVFAFSLSSWEISNNTVNHVPKVQLTLSQRRHKIIRQSRDNTSCE